MSTFMIYIADFILGLFIGMFAFAAFAPKHYARKIYTISWCIGGVFVLSAWVQKSIDTPTLLKAAPPEVHFLITTVLVGIVTSILCGVLLKKKFPLENDH